MNEKEYVIVLRINTPAGEETFGRFYLGRSKETAYEIFNQLEGEQSPDPGSLIFFDFIEMENGLPTNLKLIACSLEQAGINMKIMIKEVFKSTLIDFQ
jgi:hypothetical protein